MSTATRHAPRQRRVKGGRSMHFIVEILFTIAWWVLLFPILWIISLPIILLIALFSKEPFFATVKDKYSKVTKWWTEYGVIFSPF
jgi:hypothetical protein